MSRTVRRNKFNRKSRFFQHYWECFSSTEVKDAPYLEEWKYHSDNYYTKSCKDRKQFLKNQEYRTLRQQFRLAVKKGDCENFFLEKHKSRTIKWSLH